MTRDEMVDKAKSVFTYIGPSELKKLIELIEETYDAGEDYANDNQPTEEPY